MKKDIYPIAGGLLLAALSSLRTDAAANTWNNGSGDSLWNLTSANWTSPAIWSDGGDALFGAAGAGTVNLGEPISAASLTFAAPGYTITGGISGNPLTLLGSAPGITANANVDIATTLEGTSGLTIQGNSVVTLLGDTETGNHFTGGTFVKSGTLVLRVQKATTAGVEYGVDTIEAIDAGATVRLGTVNDGLDTATSNSRSANGQITIGGSVTPHRLNLTGGTFDTNGDDNQNQVPQPSGTGTIINTSATSRGIIKFTGFGETTTFSGNIKDGGTTITRAFSGPGYQMSVDSQSGSAGTLILAGSNSFSGFLRIGNGGTIKLSGEGTLGYPAPINCPARQIIQNNGTVDLNGTSQKTGFYNAGAGAFVVNSAAGTLSTLTLCFNCTNLTVPSQGGINCNLADSPGRIGIVKEGIAIQPLNGAANTYSGDTVVNDGTLRIDQAGAVSPNSIYRLSTAKGTLQLNYAGDAVVRGLYINGVRKPAGTYSASTAPISGTGTITVPPPNTWSNASGDSLWNLTSANWTSPAIWSDGGDALFGAAGAGTVNLGEPISAASLTFAAPGYTITGGISGNPLTLLGSAPGITANANVDIATTLEGTSGLTIQGNSVVTLLGDTETGNHFTGGTFVKSGTLVLRVQKATTAGVEYGVDTIEAIDAGATVRLGTVNDGLDTATSNSRSANGQITIGGSVTPHRLNLTGGTFDTNGDDNQNQVPQPSGTGTIINTSATSRGIIKFTGFGETTTFSGNIKDGGTTITRAFSGPGYQMSVDSQSGSAGTLILAGSNSFSGFLRIGNGGTIKLSGEGTLGYPAPINCPARQIIQNNGTVDLNGTSQKTGFYNAGAGAFVVNSAAGTLSTLTLCFNCTNLTVPSQGGINCNLADSPGRIGIVKEGIAIQPLNGAANTYSGDTVVNDGTLRIDQAGAVSPNSDFRLSTVKGTLNLNYAGTAPVKRLFINGHELPNGTYGASTAPISGTGFIEVTASTAVTTPPTLGFTITPGGGGGGAGSLSFSWTGGFKLQYQVDATGAGLTGNWTDYPGGNTGSVNVPVSKDNSGAYFRLTPLQ